jgi:hypothetical protein
MRECGGCVFCCEALDVPYLEKPGGVLCKHAVPCRGCSIYEDRPPVCHTFTCLWKGSEILGDDLRPDKCGVMFELYNSEATVIAIVKEQAEWKAGNIRLLINQMLLDGYVVWVLIGDDRHVLLPEGVSEKLAKTRAVAAWSRVMT